MITLQRVSRVVVFGDSHLRRMNPFIDLLGEKLYRGQMEVEFFAKGGAKLHHVLQKLHEARGFDIMVLMVGGNDLSSGAGKHHFERYYDLIAERARRLGIKSVIITSIWPRANREFNRFAYLHNNYMMEKYMNDPFVTFWIWDSRQPFGTFDGVHLYEKYYEKAITYLLAPIMWVAKRLEERYR